MTSLTVVVPATNAPPTLDACLDAIQSADAPPEEVITVTEGDGPADARNTGARKAAGDVVVFIDADVLPHADAFARIRQAFDDDPQLTALFGSYDDTPAAGDVVSQFRNLLHHQVHQEGAGAAATFWAGLGAVRTPDFNAAGGFDAARYCVPSVEDIDLGARLVAAGGRIVLDPSIQGTHLKHWTLAGMVTTDFWQRGVPWTELVLRHRSGALALNLGWRHRASALVAVTAAMAIVRGRPATALGALAVLAALNASFYELLLKQRGPAEAAIGVGLHAVHHVTGVVSVPVGVARHLRGGG